MNLHDDTQQNIQMELDFSSALTGEAREAGREATESSGATSGSENPASTNRFMEVVCERENLRAALRQVRANGGSPGVDGMTVVGVKDYLTQARNVGLSKAYFRSLGLPSLFEDCQRNLLEPPCTDPYARWCGGGRRATAAPMPIVALVFDPPVLLADEPTGNLDTRTGAEILKVIRDLHERFGSTILIVTHDADVAQSCPPDGELARCTRRRRFAAIRQWRCARSVAVSHACKSAKSNAGAFFF